MRRCSHITPNRSTMPTQRRLCTPYLDRPSVRGRWRTGTDATVPPCAQEQRRQETVHVIEERKLEEGVAREHLEPAAGVRRAVPEQAAAHAVGDPRGQPPQPGVVAVHAVTGDQHFGREVRAAGRTRSPLPGCLFSGRDGGLHERRDVCRVVLAVAVESGDPAVACRLHSRVDGGALPAGARVPDHPQARMARRRRLQRRGRAVVAAVIDVDHLELQQPLQRGLDLRKQRRNIALLVLHWNDHR